MADIHQFTGINRGGDMLSQSTDREISLELGQRLHYHRLARNITLEDLARRARLSKTTLFKMENGADFRLSSLLRVLRVLGLLDAVDSFIAIPAVSPLELAARLSKKPRQRASSRTRVLTREPNASPAPTFADKSGIARVGLPAATTDREPAQSRRLRNGESRRSSRRG